MNNHKLERPAMIFETVGIGFKQNRDAPELFAFVASSNKLTKICGVARKSEKLLTNYQRALDMDRVRLEITPFFKIPANSSPTSIVLSIHESPRVKIIFSDMGETSGVMLKKMTIEMDDIVELTEDEIIKAAIDFLDERLSTTTERPEDFESEFYIENDTLVRDSEDDDVDTESGLEGESEDANVDSEIDLGKSMLKELREKLVTRSDIKPDLIDALRDMLKPALVIDGQHRLFGAAAVEEDIPMLVCSLVKPDWKEQVFQFTVINDKSVGIPKPFITSLAGMSLTPEELKALTDRLAQAGVRLWEVEVMQRIGYDPKSPFYKKINFNVSGTAGLGYQTMKKVGRAWYDVRDDGLLELIRNIYQQSGSKKLNQKSLKLAWQKDELWYEYFSIFWGAIKEKFGESKIWELHSPLMTAVVLEQFQQSFLEYLGGVLSLTIGKITETEAILRKQFIIKEYKQIVDIFVSKFDEKHFSKPWVIKSLNHKDGKDLLADYFDKVFKGKPVQKHRLVHGS